MKVFFKLRAVLLVLLLVWAVCYLPVYTAKGALFAPFSACQIPLLPVFFGVDFGFVLYAVFVAISVVSVAFSLFSCFARKIWVLVLPILLSVVDIAGQIICYNAASYEQREEGRLEAYYYFNGITPAPPWFFIASLVLDVLFVALLILPAVLPVRKEKQAEAALGSGITTDNWSEIFSAEQAQDLDGSVDEEHKTECDKK